MSARTELSVLAWSSRIFRTFAAYHAIFFKWIPPLNRQRVFFILEKAEFPSHHQSGWICANMPLTFSGEGHWNTLFIRVHRILQMGYVYPEGDSSVLSCYGLRLWIKCFSHGSWPCFHSHATPSAIIKRFETMSSSFGVLWAKHLSLNRSTVVPPSL